MYESLIHISNTIKADALFETKTLQAMYKLRPINFKQIPEVSIIRKDQRQFPVPETNNN
ncbi:hypothetical protein Mgra_00008607, partial [Meloidogyne graminicola]